MDASEVYRAYNDAENRHDWDATSALLAPDITVHVNGRPEVSSPDEDRRAMDELVRTFPDYRREVVAVVGAGEQAAIRWTMTGTGTDGTRLDATGASFVVVRAGRIVQAHLFADSGALRDALARARPGGSAGA